MENKKRGRPKKINKELKEEKELSAIKAVDENLEEKSEMEISIPYTAELNMNGNIYKSEGNTAFDALSNFPIDWTNIKMKGILTLKKGEQKAEKLFYLKPLRMLFVSKIRRAGFARQLESLMKFQ